MAYSELIKNFEKIRAYMREFYVYGFKSRREYNAKSARSYDDERRRLESWLGDYMRFTQTADGKNVFLSVDSRVTQKNPFYKAWKAKSFTDGDITLHFAVLDVLYSPDVKKTLSELAAEIDRLLPCGMRFDDSTLRKKLKEYVNAGVIEKEKSGQKILYSRTPDSDISQLTDVLDFFSEVAPCGVIGSFLLDRLPRHSGVFWFKHHYITQAMDSGVMASVFDAIRKQSYITADNLNRRSDKAKKIRVIPLKIYISARSGRRHLIAFEETTQKFNAYRLDYLSNVCVDNEKCTDFKELREFLVKAEKHMWGVNCKRDIDKTERVEFEIKVGDNEQFIVNRLEREKRCGTVEKIDNNRYRYVADVFDTGEMIPWVRTFISRITKIYFSNSEAERKFKKDIQKMYKIYGLTEGDAV